MKGPSGNRACESMILSSSSVAYARQVAAAIGTQQTEADRRQLQKDYARLAANTRAALEGGS